MDAPVEIMVILLFVISDYRLLITDTIIQLYNLRTNYQLLITHYLFKDRPIQHPKFNIQHFSQVHPQLQIKPPRCQIDREKIIDVVKVLDPID